MGLRENIKNQEFYEEPAFSGSSGRTKTNLSFTEQKRPAYRDSIGYHKHEDVVQRKRELSFLWGGYCSQEVTQTVSSRALIGIYDSQGTLPWILYILSANVMSCDSFKILHSFRHRCLPQPGAEGLPSMCRQTVQKKMTPSQSMRRVEASIGDCPSIAGEE